MYFQSRLQEAAEDDNRFYSVEQFMANLASLTGLDLSNFSIYYSSVNLIYFVENADELKTVTALFSGLPGLTRRKQDGEFDMTLIYDIVDQRQFIDCAGEFTLKIFLMFSGSATCRFEDVKIGQETVTRDVFERRIVCDDGEGEQNAS